MRWLSVGVMAALLVLMAACSGSLRVSSPRTEDFGGVASGITVVPPEERKPAPRLSGIDLDGELVDSASYDGKVLVVNVWGSWCAPCREETPTLVKVATTTANKDVQFLGIAIRESAATSRAFARRFEIPYPNISNSGGELLLGFANSLPAVAVPTTYIIDRRGRVAARILDVATEPTLSALIDDALQEP